MDGERAEKDGEPGAFGDARDGVPGNTPKIAEPPGYQAYWGYQPPWDIEKWRRDQKARKNRELRANLKRFGALCVFTLFAYLGIALALMLALTPEVLVNLSERTDYLYLATPKLTNIGSLSGYYLSGFFVAIAAVIIVSFIALIGRDKLALFREMLGTGGGEHSAMLVIGGIFMAMLFMNFIYYSVIELGGAEPEIPDLEDELWIQAYVLAKASVWEEFVTRILLIGVPLIFIDLFFRRDKTLPIARYIIGGGIKIGYLECGLVIFSSEIFALAHIEGWDFWKIVPVAITGLGFGYLFLRFGLYAAVVLHFSFDFLSLPIEYVGGYPPVLIWVGILTLIWLVCGSMFFIYYLLKLTDFVRRELLKMPARKPAS